MEILKSPSTREQVVTTFRKIVESCFREKKSPDETVEFEHETPFPHKFILERKPNGELELSLVAKNPVQNDGEKFLVEVKRSCDPGFYLELVGIELNRSIPIRTDRGSILEVAISQI
jgi:hypothetical protein